MRALCSVCRLAVPHHPAPVPVESMIYFNYRQFRCKFQTKTVRLCVHGFQRAGPGVWENACNDRRRRRRRRRWPETHRMMGEMRIRKTVNGTGRM